MKEKHKLELVVKLKFWGHFNTISKLNSPCDFLSRVLEIT